MPLPASTPQMLDTNTLLERIQRNEQRQWITQCHELTLSSAYQPIISLNHRRIVGYEALIRAHDRCGQTVSPLALFERPKTIEDTIELDRLCRLLHGFNFSQHEVRNEWLFLNVNPEVISHGHRYGKFFTQMLEDSAIAPSQVVIEVLENRVTDEIQLTESVDYYRQIGCLLAIDDFGAGHSNIDRVLRLEPEIVKLDRSLLTNSSIKARRILGNLVSLLHEAGCLVVLEGIETLDETLLAFDVDADLVQGFFFSTPDAELKHTLPASFFPRLDQARKQHQQNLTRFQRGVISPYHLIFEQAISDYTNGTALSLAAQGLLQAEGVQRLYLLDEKGNLIGNNLYPHPMLEQLRPQMAPMHDSSGANFGNRHYFQRALENPQQTQTTRPYLSTTGAELCITLSRRVERNGIIEVLCCDLGIFDQAQSAHG
jgi:EAL domain-containing protein (putative c-di-GMP-specific phosphodiesterase class I)